MDIVYCTDSHAAQWDEYVQRSDVATFYHLFGWKRVNENCFGHQTYYLAATEGGEICGVLPIVLLRSPIFGKILCSMPFVNLGGPCAADADTVDALMGEAYSILARTQARFLEVRAIAKLRTARPPSEHKVSMSIELADDPDVIWGAFTAKHRKNVRRAYGHGFTSVVGRDELLEQFYDVMQESWRDLGTPLYQKSYFREILQVFAGSVSIFLLLHDDKVVGATFCGEHKQTVEGMWAGTTSEYRRSDCNYVLYWDMIKHYCGEGFQRFHLGRSTVDSGAEAFKRKWLANSRQLYWHYVTGSARRMPQLSVTNPKFKLAIRTWRHLPIAVTSRIGPIISKGIP